jgi:GPH family glycoside/pentoside/hexuronide:cation symporter
LTDKPINHRLPFWTKLAFGSGEFGPSSISMMRSLFYTFYLTDVVGLDPRLASIGAIIGLIWDAVNDPLVGIISDRVNSRWGRRRPFLLIFSVPFGVLSIILWAAPNWSSQIALIAYVTIAFMLVDTLGTLLSIPYQSLIPELTQDYDERTSIAGFRTVFQLIGSLLVVIVVPSVVDKALESGLNQRLGFVLAAAIFGILSILFYLIVFVFIRENKATEYSETLPILKMLKLAWSNLPFRFVAILFLLNWTMMDMVAVVFPFYLLYWVSQGNLLAKVSIFGLDLALESAFFGLLMLVCIAAVPFWMWFTRRRDKQQAYIVGMVFMLIVLVLIFFVQPGQIDLLLVLGGLAGFGVSTAYVLPDAMFPDIIEWDELRARRRQEGIYYGARAFIRKLATAAVIFLTLQLLGWSGYQTPPQNVTNFTQPDSALLMIRIMISGVSGGMTLIAILLAWLNPLTRDKNARIRRLLEKRKNQTLF